MNELPEQVRIRVEATKDRLKKADTILKEDSSTYSNNKGTKTRSAASNVVAFPDIPKLDLSILRA
jgi:hypothetical protein